MRRLVLLFLLAVTPLSAATISGTVTQSGPGTALGGMTVQAYDTGGGLQGRASSSDSTGRYTLTLDIGTYRVLAFDPARVYATSFYADAGSFERSPTLALESNLTSVNFALERGGFIAGAVTASSGLPLAGITVSAYNSDGSRRGFTTTDSAGHYRLVLPPGNFVLAAYDDAQTWLTGFYSGASSFATATIVSVIASQTTTANVTLLRGGTIEGMITDAVTKASISGAQISAYRDGLAVATVTTDLGGRYRMLLPPGTYRCVIFDPNGIYAAVFATGAASFDTSTLFVLGSSDTRTIDAQLQRGGRLTGRVSDAFTATGLANISVAAFNGDGTTRAFTTTNSLGDYVLVVPPGSYRVGAFDTNLLYLRRFAPSVPAFGSALQSTVFASQTTTVDLQLPRGAIISGQVQSSLAALSGITVAAYDSSGVAVYAVTDATGRYRLLLEPGSFTLAAYDPAFRFATSTQTTAVTYRQTLTNLDFALVIGAHVSGKVQTSSGIPVGTLTVAAYGSDGHPVVTATTRSTGEFDLVVPPGSYRFAAFDSQRRFGASPLTAFYVLTASQVVGGLDLRVNTFASPRRRAATH